MLVPTTVAAPVALDDTDRRLLGLLQADASLSNDELARRAHVSAATSLRRVRRLQQAGVIERRIAVLNWQRVGSGLTAIVEVTLENQSAEAFAQFAKWTSAVAEVQQCYQVASGPDFVLIVFVRDMGAYHAFVHGVLTAAANVRNVRSFFVVERTKFAPSIPL